MKRTYLLIVLLFATTLLAAGQNRYVSSRPPWIMGEVPSWTVGELPIIDLHGNYLRVQFTQDFDPEVAESKGEDMIASYLVSKAGVTISSTKDLTVIEETGTVSRNGQVGSQTNYVRVASKKVTVSGKTFGRYCLLDKYIQYKNGLYYFAGLYLIADNDMSLASVPPITYGMDRGAWRSLIVPGWAQFYQGRTGAGIAFLATEAALIGTTMVFQSKVNINAQRFNEATSLEVKKAYKQRHDTMQMWRNISAGASIAWYAYNAVDAFTSKKGRLYYTVAYGNRQYSIGPAPVMVPQTGDLALGITCNVTF